MGNNESWISPLIQDKTLQQYYDDIAKMVKEKTGRSMQTKEKKRIDKKTGKAKLSIAALQSKRVLWSVMNALH